MPDTYFYTCPKSRNRPHHRVFNFNSKDQGVLFGLASNLPSSVTVYDEEENNLSRSPLTLLHLPYSHAASKWALLNFLPYSVWISDRSVNTLPACLDLAHLRCYSSRSERRLPTRDSYTATCLPHFSFSSLRSGQALRRCPQVVARPDNTFRIVYSEFLLHLLTHSHSLKQRCLQIAILPLEG